MGVSLKSHKVGDGANWMSADDQKTQQVVDYIKKVFGVEVDHGALTEFLEMEGVFR